MTSINGHSVNTSVMTDLGFVDLERIEVLKWSSRNTYLVEIPLRGVVNLVTKRPTR
ncbi:MAG: hypothetical protein ACJ0FM_03020 [Gammaproteobacteria bacterium]